MTWCILHLYCYTGEKILENYWPIADTVNKSGARHFIIYQPKYLALK